MATRRTSEQADSSSTSETPTQELLGGPYNYTGTYTAGMPNPTATLLETLAASEPAASPLDPSLAPEIDPETGVPNMIAEPPAPPRTIPAVTNDESQGGSNIEDPEAAATAADSADDEPDESMTVTANRVKRNIRPLQDEDFILMHAYNLVNLRNEKMNFQLEELPPDKLEDVDGDKKGDDVALNTVRAIKGPLPYAYVSTPSHPKEINAAIQCIGDPAGFTNYLKATPDIQRHLDLTTEQLSNLTTKIRLYKLFQSEKEPQIVEFVFETAGMGQYELEEMMNSKGKKRGYGVGIKSFNFVNQSKYIHLVDKRVTAELTLYADSLDSLLKTRYGSGESEGLEYRFTDLALRKSDTPLSVTGGKFGSLSDLTFQIIIEVGLTKSVSKIAGLSSDSTSMVMKLNPTTHNLSFNMDGSLELTIEYFGVVEAIFSQPVKFDIFKSAKNLVNEYATEFAAIAYQNRCGGKDIQRIKTALTSISNQNKDLRIKQLNDALRQKNKIYYINITDGILKAWNDVFNNKLPKESGITQEEQDLNEEYVKKAVKELQNALGTKIPVTTEEGTSALPSNISSPTTNQKQAQKMQKDMEEKQPPQSNIRDCAIDPNSNQIPFFYASDLINIILENISDTYTRTTIHNATTQALDIVQNQAGITDPNDKAGMAFQTAVNAATIGGDVSDKSFNEMIEFEDKQFESLEHFKKLRVVLGPMHIHDFFSKANTVCSIGDIPVSLRHFNQWLSEKMIKNNRYSVHAFLIEFIAEYLKTYLKAKPELNDLGTIGRDYLFGHTSYFGFGNKFKEEGYDTDPLTLMRLKHPLAAGRKSLNIPVIESEYRPLINLRSNSISANRKKDAYDYLVFYQSDASFSLLPQIGMSERAIARQSEEVQAHAEKVYGLVAGNKQLARKGIGAYFHGRDRGIVKNIEYAKHDVANLKGVLTAEVGSNNLDGLLQFREVFNAKLTTFANFEVSPGDFIFIDPESASTYLSKETRESLGSLGTQFMGVGGFFTVRAVSHFFEQGKFETTIDTIFSKTANAQYTIAELAIQKAQKKVAEPNKQEQEELKRKQSECKASLQLVENTENATLERAAGVASRLLAGLEDFATGLFKAIFDNSDAEISDNDLESAIGSGNTPTSSNPNQGNEKTANNGPVT